MEKSIVINLEKTRKIIVFGVGRSGISAIRLLRYLKKELFAVNSGPVASWIDGVKDLVDEQHCFCQDDALSLFPVVDLIILSPGIPLTHPALVVAKSAGVPIWSEIELGYQFAQAPIVGITGTNGKTTTVSLLEYSLAQTSLKVFVGGNIGIPFCDMAYQCLVEGKKFDLIILELSSFQLETIHKFRPNIAAILNISLNHGERYVGLHDYLAAKLRILDNMMEDDLFIAFNASWVNDIKKCRVLKLQGADHLQEILDLSKRKIIGEHNLKNIAIAYSILQELEANGVLKDARKTLQVGIDQFKGVEHRIEYVSNPNGKYSLYNDAKSTNFEATTSAITAFDDSSLDLYLIYGGKARSEIDSIIEHLDFLKDKVARIYLIGETTDKFSKEIRENSSIDFVAAYTLENVRSLIEQQNFSGNLLFSPGFPSFDQFKNYVDRGNSFKKIFGGM